MINLNVDDLYSVIQRVGEESEEVDELYFYRNMYDAVTKLEHLYKNGYNEKKTYKDIVKKLSTVDKAKEYIRLCALETSISALMIGLNREALEKANSNTNNHSLFQYLNYKCNEGVTTPWQNLDINADNYANLLKCQLGFNPSNTGPFPNMLEVIKTDNRTRPYDYVAKIRNAMEHGGYYQKKGNVHFVEIKNTDNDITTFEGRLMLWSFQTFIRDFYGQSLGVADEFCFYRMPQHNDFNNKEELRDLLQNYHNVSVIFTNIPDEYKFNGQRSIFYELGKCFGLNNSEEVNIGEKLNELSSKGIKFELKDYTLKDEVIDKVIEYLEYNYGSELYNNSDIKEEVFGVVKLVHCPVKEITNCLGNILRYIEIKKCYLGSNEFVEDLFLEQHYDQYLKLPFEYTLMLIKANVINYALENDKFKLPDMSEIDLSKISVFPTIEYQKRYIEALENGIDLGNADAYVKLQTVRNSLAHGDKRLLTIPGKDKNITFRDIYNSNVLQVSGGLEEFKTIYSSDCFKPENIKLKDSIKVKSIGKL